MGRPDRKWTLMIPILAIQPEGLLMRLFASRQGWVLNTQWGVKFILHDRWPAASTLPPQVNGWAANLPACLWLLTMIGGQLRL